MKAKLLSLLMVLSLTSCYDKTRTIFYDTLDGEPIKIPSSYNEINKNSYSLFDGCYIIELAEGYNNIKDLFRNNKQLTKLVVPDCISTINDSAFIGCKNLSHVELPENVQIGNKAFKGCTSLEVFKIPYGTSKISDWLFQNCIRLRKVILPKGLKHIGVGAFSGCLKLDSISLPESLEMINAYTFNNCQDLSSIVLPKNLIYVDDKAFRGCDNLESVTIQCKRIGNCFSGLSPLKEIVISNTDSISQIALNAFVGTEWYNKQPNGFLYYGNLLLGYKGDNIPDSVIINKTCTNMAISLFENCSNIKYVEIPLSVKHIPDSLFYNCENLRYVKMHNDIQSLGAYSFYNCYALDSINIPNSLKRIGNCTFAGCSNIPIIKLPDTMSVIGDSAFYGCKKINSIIIPNGITFITKSAFQDCKNLKEVQLSSSVKEIKTLAFAGCDNISKINISNNVNNVDEFAFPEYNKLNVESRVVIRTNSIKNGRVLHSDLSAKIPFLVYLEKDSICCEKYYPIRTQTDVLFSAGKKFITVSNRLENIKGKFVYKKEKDTCFLSNFNKENIICHGKSVAIRVYQQNYITNIDSPGILYPVSGLIEDGVYEPYIYTPNCESLWELPDFNDVFSDYDSNAYLYFARGGGVPDYSSILYLDGKGDVIKNKTAISINDSLVPISYIGTSKIVPCYIGLIKKMIDEAGGIPDMKRMYISQITKTLDQLHAAFRDNKVRAEEELVGKEIYLECEIETIERAGFMGWGYKYKISSSALEVFGEWISGYDFIGYTNDDGFVNLNYPAKVILKGNLYYGDGKLFKFDDCEFLYLE